MSEIFAFVLFCLGLFFLYVGWIMFCMTRGLHKSYSLANDLKWTPELLYALGNPFDSFEGGCRQ